MSSGLFTNPRLGHANGLTSCTHSKTARLLIEPATRTWRCLLLTARTHRGNPLPLNGKNGNPIRTRIQEEPQTRLKRISFDRTKAHLRDVLPSKLQKSIIQVKFHCTEGLKFYRALLRTNLMSIIWSRTDQCRKRLVTPQLLLEQLQTRNYTKLLLMACISNMKYKNSSPTLTFWYQEALHTRMIMSIRGHPQFRILLLPTEHPILHQGLPTWLLPISAPPNGTQQLRNRPPPHHMIPGSCTPTNNQNGKLPGLLSPVNPCLEPHGTVKEHIWILTSSPNLGWYHH